MLYSDAQRHITFIPSMSLSCPHLTSPLQGLLSSPEPDDPLDTNVAEHWKTNEKAAMEKAKEWTQRYAS